MSLGELYLARHAPGPAVEPLERARQLATLAQRVYAQAGDGFVEQRKEIDAWIRGRRSAN